MVVKKERETEHSNRRLNQTSSTETEGSGEKKGK